MTVFSLISLFDCLLGKVLKKIQIVTEGVSSRTLSCSVYLILADFISRSFNTESYLYVYLFILFILKVACIFL